MKLKLDIMPRDEIDRLRARRESQALRMAARMLIDEASANVNEYGRASFKYAASWLRGRANKLAREARKVKAER